MSACSQCGTVAKATDRFCNVCGTPLARASTSNAPAQAAPAPQYAPTPQPAPAYSPQPSQGQYGAPPSPVARCQMGHEIAPGASYCQQGHPIALDQMQFSNEGYGGQGYAPQQGYGTPPRQGSGAYGAPPPQAYGVPPAQPAPQGYGAPPAPAPQPAPQAYAPAPAPQYGGGAGYIPTPGQPAYAPAPAAGYGAPPPAPFASDANVPPKILRGFLVAYGANPSGDFWPLTGGRLVVGRTGAAEGTDISMQDPTISSRHAALIVDAASGSVVIEDTGSTNGTFVNDEHIGFNGRREVRDGDRLRFGGFTTFVKVIGRV
jgi:FHA domain